jgi:hypothetical protein
MIFLSHGTMVFFTDLDMVGRCNWLKVSGRVFILFYQRSVLDYYVSKSLISIVGHVVLIEYHLYVLQSVRVNAFKERVVEC